MEISEIVFLQLIIPLQACNVDSTLVGTITNVRNFNRALIRCRTRQLDIKFEPENLMEEYYAFAHQLLTYPCALPPGGPGSPLLKPGIEVDYKPSFETALRAATLLCLRAPTLEIVSRQRANANLLNLLFKELEIILAWLRQERQRRAEAGVYDPAHEFIVNARPFLIWMCLLGDVISTYTNFHLIQRRGLNRRNSVVCQLMVEILGGSRDVDDITDADLQLTRLWNIDFMIGGKWDERMSLQRILEGP
jgi:hypothetical protein